MKRKMPLSEAYELLANVDAEMLSITELKFCISYQRYRRLAVAFREYKGKLLDVIEDVIVLERNNLLLNALKDYNEMYEANQEKYNYFHGGVINELSL